jgi:UDP-2,3-diacylglucosamine hydrolase
MRRVFLSDVHLSPRQPERSDRFVRFLEREAERTGEFFILGDLFDYWIGPKHLRLPDYREALEALRRVTGTGRRVVFLLGNRDFYLSRGFSESTGVQVAPARTDLRMAAGTRRVYLCHGDYLEGRAGLGFRIQEVIRSRLVEAVFTRLPSPAADALARFYRWLSGRKTRRPKSQATHLGSHGLCDERLLEEFRRSADVIVCGHIHVPQEVPFLVDGREAVLFTLGDWSEGESFLVEEDGHWRLCGGQKGQKTSGRTGGHSATV